MKTIYISGIIGWDIIPDDIRAMIDSKSTEKLRVIINSNGGYVSDGFEIRNILKAYKGEVETVIGVMAASIASYIAMVSPLEKRKGFKNSSFMVHEVQAGIYGRARDFSIYAERVEGLNNIIAESYSEGLNMTKEEARNIMTEDKFFTGWESLVENNIISDVLDLEDVDIPQKEEDEETFIIYETFANEIEKDIDISILKAKFYESDQKIITDVKRSTQDMTKAAALFKVNKQTNQESNTDNSVNDKNLKTEDNKMPKLEELLNSNSEAQAEYTANLQAAEQKGKDEAMQSNDVGKERSRIHNILKFSGVNISKDTAKAINEGQDASEFAQEELMRERNKREGDDKNAVDFGNLVNKDLPGDQDEKGKKEAKGDKEEELKAFDEKLDEAAKKKKEVK